MGHSQVVSSAIAENGAANGAAREWKQHWGLVLACFVGFSLPAVAINSVGLFLDPLHREFGWSRTEITAGLTLSSLIAVPLSPFVGALVDRWGSRALAIPGIVLTSLAMCSLSFAQGSMTQWLVLWTLYAFAALLVKATVWTTAISSTFDAGKGLALAVTLCGTGLSGALAPPLARWLTDAYGWRSAFAALGLGWGAVTLILTLFFMFDARDRARVNAGATLSQAPELPGLSIHEAARSLPLYRVGLATLITMMLGTGIIVHKVPLLTAAGVTRESAAYLASLSGIAAILGKLATGWLMDRFDAGTIGAATLGVAALAFALLLEPFRNPTTIVISMFVIGYSSGTKLQICAHLTGVYAGMRCFGKIFGVMASIIALGAGTGPLLTSAIYDLSGGYAAIILVSIPASLISAGLLIRLGNPPDWRAVGDPSNAAAKPQSL